MDVRLKRAYELAEATDGYRVLVDRLWPRGVSKDKARLGEWARELAPSSELRTWFGHDPSRFDEFRRRYKKELDAHPDIWEPLRSAARRGRVTLLYSAHDVLHNSAIVLRDYLARRSARRSR